MHLFLHAVSILARRLNIQILPQVLAASASGADPAACLAAAAQLGLPTRVLRMRIQDILPQALPCLVLLKGESNTLKAGVLLAKDGSDVLIILPETDPAETRLPVEELEKIYTGECVFPARGEAHAAQQPESMPESGWLKALLWQYAPLYRDVALAGGMINLLALAMPLFVMNVYDRVIPHNAVVTLWVLAAGVGVAFVADAALRVLRAHYVDVACRNVDVVLSTRLLRAVLHKRLEACPPSAGQLVHTLHSFEQVREMLGSTNVLAVLEVPFVCLFIALMAWIGGPLAWFPLLSVPLLLAVGMLMQHVFGRNARAGQQTEAMRQAVLTEVVSGLEDVKGSLLHEALASRYEYAVDAAAAARFAGRRLGVGAAQVVTSLSMFINVGMVITGVYLIAANALSVGGLVACVILLGRCLGPLSQLAGVLAQWQRSAEALRRIESLMALPDEAITHPANLPAGVPGFSLEQASFAYPAVDTPLLRDLSVSIAPGEHVGIVGASGSGKSTLARLLVGLYRPTEGRVRVGGVDVTQLVPTMLRSRVGYTAQDPVLFSGSIRDNLLLGQAMPDERQLLLAAEVAGVLDFATPHPRGIDLPVGEKGRQLSGGQRQAVAVARALVRNPAAVVLDEPTSHFDSTAEQRFIARMQTFMHGRTLVLCTHRPAVLQLVTRVIVLDKGRILMDGPRDAVLHKLTALSGIRPAGQPPLPRVADAIQTQAPADGQHHVSV